AHLHARWALGAGEAEVALGRHLDRLAVGALLPPLDHDDVAPRAALRAVRAADARGLVDRDLQRPDRARDGPGRAIDHAHRVGALVAGGRHQPVAVLLPFADEARLAAVRVRAAPHALVAPGARGQVDEEHAFPVDQPRLHGHLEVLGGARPPPGRAAHLEAR